MNAIELGHNNKTDDFHGDNWQHCDPKLVTCQIVLGQGSHYLNMDLLGGDDYCIEVKSLESAMQSQLP